jgi:membrane dipeptidase
MAMTKGTDGLLVLDAHCDSLILRQVRGDPIDLAVADPVYEVDLPRLRAGGVGCLFCMVGDSDLRQSSLLIDAVHEMARSHPQDFRVCRTAGEVRAACADGRIALVLTIEGQKMFEESLAHLRNWHRLGVRLASLTHGGGRPPELQIDRSFFGYLTADERARLRRHSKGLTPFARDALAQMAALKMPLDLAHANDAAFWEVIETAECPLCYTHGSCYALCPHTRALTDEMMKALADRGGVMGIAFYRHFIDTEAPTLQRLCDHFLHAVEIMGPRHVGIGSDFDGTPGHLRPIPEDCSKMGELFDALTQRGVDAETLRGIAGENFLRLLAE